MAIYPKKIQLNDRREVDSHVENMKCLGWLKEFIRMNGYPPSIRAAADAWNTTHTTAHTIIAKLEDDGYIQYAYDESGRRIARTLKVIRDPS